MRWTGQTWNHALIFGTCKRSLSSPVHPDWLWNQPYLPFILVPVALFPVEKQLLGPLLWPSG
jgi:hypothetical protein